MDRIFIEGDPLVSDVKCAKSAKKSYQEHSGNLKYNEIIRKYRDAYQAGGADKTAITRQVLQETKTHRIRFIQQDEQGRWCLLEEDLVWEKVQKSLRLKPKSVRKRKAAEALGDSKEQHQSTRAYCVQDPAADKVFHKLLELQRDLLENSSLVEFQNHTELIKGVREPKFIDVLFGRGGLCNNHSGNKLMRRLIAANIETRTALEKNKKSFLAKTIVHTIRLAGGRFLSKDKTSGLWNEVVFQNAFNKVSQTFRDESPNGSPGSPSAVADCPAEQTMAEPGQAYPVPIPLNHTNRSSSMSTVGSWRQESVGILTSIMDDEGTEGKQASKPPALDALTSVLPDFQAPKPFHFGPLTQQDYHVIDMSVMAIERLGLSGAFQPQLMPILHQIEKNGTSSGTLNLGSSIGSKFSDEEHDISRALAQLGDETDKVQAVSGQTESLGSFGLTRFDPENWQPSWSKAPPIHHKFVASTSPAASFSSYFGDDAKFDSSPVNGDGVAGRETRTEMLRRLTGVTGGPDNRYARDDCDVYGSDDDE